MIPSSIRAFALVLAALLPAACQAPPPDAGRDLAGSWQLVTFQGGDDRALVPDDAKDWSYVRAYVIRDGHLFLSLLADAGVYEFERQ